MIICLPCLLDLSILGESSKLAEILRFPKHHEKERFIQPSNIDDLTFPQKLQISGRSNCKQNTTKAYLERLMFSCCSIATSWAERDQMLCSYVALLFYCVVSPVVDMTSQGLYYSSTAIYF